MYVSLLLRHPGLISVDLSVNVLLSAPEHAAVLNTIKNSPISSLLTFLFL